jgi:hypothetical protein
MPEALIITPVKDSLTTTARTIESVFAADGDFLYIIYNDFSGNETKEFLEKNTGKFNYQLVNLEDLTTTPSPNYKLVLRQASSKAMELNIPLIIIESDVIIKKDTISGLLESAKRYEKTGMVGAVTVNEQGQYNFPYDYLKEKKASFDVTRHSLSFCCTLLATDLLSKVNFEELPVKKDWYDIYISRKSKKLGFKNYLATQIEVVHLPHSSRPWKLLKYSNPVKYYIYKYLKHRDRI